ncbi:MAG TPA: hypothetical protein VF941_16255, partial [Clostridia bacterium]
VIINIDAFWIPLAHTYQIQHQNHFVLAIGFDEMEKTVQYIDPYLSNNISSISLDTLVESSANCIRLVFEDSSMENVIWQEAVRESVLWTRRTKDDGNDCFRSINLFADEIESSLNVENEVKGYEFESIIPLFFNLFCIGSNRFKYARFLNYFANRFNLGDFSFIKKKLEMMMWEWYEIRSALIKAGRGTVNDDEGFKKKLSNKLREIAEEEHKISEIILEVCG